MIAQPHAVGESGTMSARVPSLVPKEVKVDKPLTFNGDKKKLQNFLFVMKQYVDTVGLGTGPAACRFVVSYLLDDALTWWRSYSQDSLSIFDNVSLDELLTALESHFSDVDREMKLRAKLFNMQQTGSVAAFTTAFQQVQLELGTARVSDDVAMHLYVHALKPMT